jgi:hypothetical protein
MKKSQFYVRILKDDLGILDEYSKRNNIDYIELPSDMTKSVVISLRMTAEEATALKLSIHLPHIVNFDKVMDKHIPKSLTDPKENVIL